MILCWKSRCGAGYDLDVYHGGLDRFRVMARKFGEHWGERCLRAQPVCTLYRQVGIDRAWKREPKCSPSTTFLPFSAPCVINSTLLY